MKAVKRNAVILTVMLFICAAVYLNWSYNKKVEDAASLGGGDPAGDVLPTGDILPAGDTLSGADTLSTGGSAARNTGAADEGDAGLYYSVASAPEDTGAPASDAPADLTDPAADGAAQPVSSAGSDYEAYFAQVRLERSQARDEAAATLSAVASADGASQETIDGALRAMTDMAAYAVREAELESQIRAKGFIDCVVYLTGDSVSVTAAKEGGLDQASVAQITDAVVSGTGLPASALTVTEVAY